MRAPLVIALIAVPAVLLPYSFGALRRISRSEMLSVGPEAGMPIIILSAVANFRTAIKRRFVRLPSVAGPPWAGMVLAGCIVMICASGGAGAQGAPPKDFIGNPRTFLGSCAPGHRIEFQFGANSLHVDPRWLDDITVQSLARRFRNQCPAEPVRIEPGRGLDSALDFNRSVVAAAGITPSDLGRSYFKLTIAAIAPLENAPTSIPQAPPHQPLLVDVTAEAPRTPLNRVYELRYPGDRSDAAATVRVACDGSTAGPGAMRTCFTVESHRNPYWYRGTMAVYYVFRQEQLPLPEARQEMPAAVMTEPEGILAFDTRIRAWIEAISVQTPAAKDG